MNCVPQLCRFTAPVPHLAVYAGICEAQSTASPGLMTLPNSAACPSPISVAIDSTPASERRFDGNGGPSSSHFPSIAEASVSEEENQPTKSRMALSLSRLLRRGCNVPSVFASLSPKCAVASGGGKVQPLGVEPLAQPQPRRIAKLVHALLGLILMWFYNIWIITKLPFQLFSNQSWHPTWMPHLPHWFRRWGGRQFWYSKRRCERNHLSMGNCYQIRWSWIEES